MAISEQFHTEIETKGATARRFVRVFEGLQSDIVDNGGAGWTGTGLPLLGGAYPYGVWTTLVTPRCYAINVDPRFTGLKIRVTAHYSAPRCLSEE